MKCIVETTGEFQLLAPDGLIHFNKPTLAENSSFLQGRIANGEVKVLHQGIPDEASAEEFQAYLNDAEDTELAVASFVSKFEEKPKPKAKPKTKPKK